MNIKKFLKVISSLFLTAKADKVTTAVVNSGDNVKFTDAVRAVYSKEVEFKALPVMRFRQFADVKTELGVTPGLTISMLTYDNLKLGGSLTEMTAMVAQNLSGSTKQITVSEFGNAVAVTELLIQSSFDDIMASATTLLSRDYALVMDCSLRDCALTGTNRVYASKKDGTKITQRIDLVDECVLQVATIKDAVEILSTNNAPKHSGTNWICLIHPHQSRTLRDDKAWINASNYGAPTQLFTGRFCLCA